MQTAIGMYFFIGTIWFFQEWKDTKDIPSSLIIGLFWVYEVFDVIVKKIKR